MAYRAFKPQEVKFKKVVNNRGKKVDKFAAEINTNIGFNPWSSNYDVDFNRSLAQKQETPIRESSGVGYKKYNPLKSGPALKKKNNFTNNNSDLNRYLFSPTHKIRLNDAVSVNSWEVRGQGIGQPNQNSLARQQHNNTFNDDRSPQRIMTANHLNRKPKARDSAYNLGNSNMDQNFQDRQNRSQLTIASSKQNAGKNDNPMIQRVGKGGENFGSQKNQAFKKKARPVTAINGSQKGNFFGVSTPRDS